MILRPPVSVGGSDERELWLRELSLLPLLSLFPLVDGDPLDDDGESDLRRRLRGELGTQPIFLIPLGSIQFPLALGQVAMSGDSWEKLYEILGGSWFHPFHRYVIFKSVNYQ